MKDIRWLINRLKAMNTQEIAWRVKEKYLQKKEKNILYSLKKPVTDIPLPSDIAHLHININKLYVNWNNRIWTEFKTMDLLNSFDYAQYKNAWNAGFQTENTWPEEPFSPTISINQRTDIGDIRTNWELNRHFQFAALAKSYYCTREDKFFVELKYLFDDWNTHNLFLHGVEWTSAMELAIRVNSWVYMFCFLKKAGCDEEILEKIEHGILVMVHHIQKHRARFSSANNHLIVEMYAVALVGIITDYSPWRDEALRILTEELPRQNYADGINMEMSIHYQSFAMEAYGLLWLSMMKNHIEIPEIWRSYLTAMAEFLADATDEFGTTIEFGDSDEGKILDLNGRLKNHYEYVLNIMGCILGRKYTDTAWHENLDWIAPEKMKGEKEKYVPSLVCSRKEGGYTYLRSRDRKTLIGIDHAALGFGSLAAHGHADALSFQIVVNGQPLFVDSGTYSYHCAPEIRNTFRSTKGHNTVTVCGKDQSEMLGPFLWGDRAECRLLTLEKTAERTFLAAEHNGYLPIIHRREFDFDGSKTLIVKDILSEACDYMASFLLAPNIEVKQEENKVYIGCNKCTCEVEFIGDTALEVLLKNVTISRKYGERENSRAIRVHSYGLSLTTKILIGS